MTSTAATASSSRTANAYVEVEELSEAQLVDRLRELEELKARCAAEQALATVALDGVVRRRQAERGLAAARQGKGVAAQVGLARRESPVRGAQHLGLAKALVHEMPHTLAAMRQGWCSEWRATLLARETACLSADDRRRIDADLMADPDRTDGWGDRRLGAEARKAAYRLDPHAVTARARRAVDDRHVSIRPAPDTMTYVTALLPVAQGVACYATLQREADRLRATGDTRGRGQLMADALTDRLTAPATGSAAAPVGASGPPPMPIAVNLTVSDATLFGGGHEPAWVTGYGPVPAGLARELAASAIAGARATLRRLYTTAGGALVSMDSRSRTFPPALALLIDLRDQTCRTPWCDAPVRHRDHVDPAADGGPTSEANGQGLCEACNQAKEAPDWRARTVARSTSGAHVVEITAPSGHRYRSRAPALPAPGSPPRRDQHTVYVELYHRRDLSVTFDRAS